MSKLTDEQKQQLIQSWLDEGTAKRNEGWSNQDVHHFMGGKAKSQADEDPEHAECIRESWFFLLGILEIYAEIEQARVIKEDLRRIAMLN